MVHRMTYSDCRVLKVVVIPLTMSVNGLMDGQNHELLKKSSRDGSEFSPGLNQQSVTRSDKKSTSTEYITKSGKGTTLYLQV